MVGNEDATSAASPASSIDPLEALREWAQTRRYVLSEHVIRALMSGAVSVPEIEAVLRGGRVIEEHRHIGRAPAYLFCGVVQGKPVHVVAAAGDDDHLVASFAYVPSPPLWLDPRHRAPRHDRGDMTPIRCFFCGGDIKSVTVGNFDYRLEGKLYVIKRVPAGLCLQCGEKYVDADASRRLNELIAAQRFTATEQVRVIEYQ